MSKISFVTATLIFTLGLVSIGFAFQNEPEGFRGVKWGDPPGKIWFIMENLKITIMSFGI